MAIYRRYQCPDCEGQFDFLHHPSDEPPPSHCPLCGTNVAGGKKKKPRLKRAITAASIKTVVSKSADSVYRQMETSSDVRREQAAQMLGVDARSLGGMKMTNMKDGLRQGDMSHVPSAATKITGSAVDIKRPDGVPLGASFGSSSSVPIGLPGQPVREMSNTMSSVFKNHQTMVQATVASGKKQ